MPTKAVPPQTFNTTRSPPVRKRNLTQGQDIYDSFVVPAKIHVRLSDPSHGTPFLSNDRAGVCYLDDAEDDSDDGDDNDDNSSVEDVDSDDEDDGDNEDDVFLASVSVNQKECMQHRSVFVLESKSESDSDSVISTVGSEGDNSSDVFLPCMSVNQHERMQQRSVFVLEPSELIALRNSMGESDSESGISTDGSEGDNSLDDFHPGMRQRYNAFDPRPGFALRKKESNVFSNSDSDSDSSNLTSIGSLRMSGLLLNSLNAESRELPVTVKRFSDDSAEQDKQLFETPVDNQGNNQLHISIVDKDVDRTLEIIGKAREFDDLNAINNRGQTALHLAVGSRQAIIVRKLMCAGASVTAVDGEGNTPLFLACCLGDIESVKQLTHPVNYTETSGNTYDLPYTPIPSVYNGIVEDCLNVATGNGQDEMVKILSELIA